MGGFASPAPAVRRAVEHHKYLVSYVAHLTGMVGKSCRKVSKESREARLHLIKARRAVDTMLDEHASRARRASARSTFEHCVSNALRTWCSFDVAVEPLLVNVQKHV